ncbi:hypothetical protein BN14_12235 [Rhizoctonia solani AG-1 IB]|uniref:Uncharacterized protein n=1 Tax=Thanatephorus cucumeris (strain AG1-IB / isolate 7/3/14) TaxID=1108050 RepID=M5CF51_THACB|nr:hypothetical protein BN14_12235 [Rhizoctonia solani AG-1 IB]
MDLKRKHAAGGLTRSRLKRQFGLSETEPILFAATPNTPIDLNDEAAEEVADIDMMEEDTGPDFTNVAAQLYQDVVDDEDPSDDEDLPRPESTTAHRSTETSLPKRVRLFFGTQVAIELKELFNYEQGDDEQGLGIFKRSGMGNLEKELEIHELATRESEGAISPENTT